MTILLVQTFLLLMGAFLLGTSLACAMRRRIAGRDEAALAVPSAAGAVGDIPRAADTDRFGRALIGGHGAGVPPVFAGQPVVEVQPRPASVEPAPGAAPVARAPAPVPAPAVEAAPAPQPAPPATAEPVTTPDGGESYAQVAVAAAAVAMAAAAARAKEQEEAAAREAEDAARAQEDAERAVEAERAAEDKRDADAAEAERLAREAAAAPASAPQTEEADTDTDTDADTASSHYGTPVEEGSLAVPPGSWDPIDDLTRIHGIDSDLRARLNRYGIHQFAAIAAWTPDDVRAANQSLGFQGRIESEHWVEQAQILAAGGDVSRTRRQSEPTDVAVPVNGDRLHRIIGIDPQSEALLYANGVVGLADIAGWTAADVERMDGVLGTPGRIGRESWVEQALFLTRGLHQDGDAPEVADEAASHSEVSDVSGGEFTPAEPPAPEEPVSDAAAKPRGESYVHLRSVRSEALRGEAPAFATSTIDDLKRIRGIGVLIERKLNSLGITAYEQVANWTGADIDRVSQLLDFKGRIERENWIEQARILASGGQTEFSRRVDRGDA